MRLESTDLAGVVLVHPEIAEDERGRFVRTFDAETLAEVGLGKVQQMSVSANPLRHTLRGLHFQEGAHAETKLVRCSRGSVFDVAVDLRPASPTFGRWFGIELDNARAVALLVPRGCAHGFLTLEEDCEVSYLIDQAHAPHAAGGLRYDDPDLGINWPAPPAVISERDRGLPSLISWTNEHVSPHGSKHVPG